MEEVNAKQEQIHDLLFSRELGWQEIIYDLINTEQLNVWDVDIIILTEKYLEKVQALEEADFFVSSKVLLAASLLLRIKTEILLNDYIQNIDDILFGKKEVKKYELERIELDEEIPLLIPRSPMPRFKKVTIKELMEALNKAITTENRRIKKVILNRNALRETGISMPKKTFSIKNKIRDIYNNLLKHFDEDEKRINVSFNDFVGTDREQRIIFFSPLLHLENQKKVWLEQNGHFDEIYIWLKKTYWKHHGNPFEDLKDELENEIAELGDEERVKEIDGRYGNPLGEMFD